MKKTAMTILAVVGAITVALWGYNKYMDSQGGE